MAGDTVCTRIFWRSLLNLSPELYERCKARTYHFAYPDHFNATKSIFIHVPKAAGTSIGMALYGCQIPHTSWRVWSELNPLKFKTYFKFAVVRDPVSRFGSSFDYLKSGGMNEDDRLFGETVLKPFGSADELGKALIDPVLQAKVLDWWHFKPQADFIADERGQSKMDFLIRHENLAAGYEQVAKKLNRAERKLPHLNKTPGQRRNNFSPEARDLLARLYQKDFVLWNEHAS